MKRLSFLFFFVLLAGCMVLAQDKVTVKAGTVVSLESVKEVRASRSHVGEVVDFKVLRDVKVDGKIAIPAGTLVKGAVYEAKRSTAFGTKGRLGIKIKYLNLPNGDVLNFTSSEVYITGKNRTAISVVVFFFTLLPFPCGSKAVMPAGYECEATVANNTTVILE